MPLMASRGRRFKPCPRYQRNTRSEGPFDRMVERASGVLVSHSLANGAVRSREIHVRPDSFIDVGSTILSRSRPAETARISFRFTHIRPSCCHAIHDGCLGGALLVTLLALGGCGSDDSDARAGTNDATDTPTGEDSDGPSDEQSSESDEPTAIVVCGLLSASDLQAVFASPFHDGEATPPGTDWRGSVCLDLSLIHI